MRSGRTSLTVTPVKVEAGAMSNSGVLLDQVRHALLPVAPGLHEDGDDDYIGGDDSHSDSDSTPLLMTDPLSTEASPVHDPSNGGSVEGEMHLGTGSTVQDDEHCHAFVDHLDSARQKGVVKVKRKLILAIIFCFLFGMAEALGGYISGSYAIISDAAHMLSDFANLVIGLLAVYLGSVSPKKRYNFGLIRAEALGALFSVLLIWNVAAVILFESINRIIHNNFEIQSTPMIVAGACAVVFNIFMVFFLRGLPHAHSHGHSHGPSHNHVRLHDEGDSVDEEGHTVASSPRQHLNVRAAIVHAFGDVLQSTGVFVVSLIIKFKPDLKILDPVCSIVFCAIVVYTTVFVFADTIRILMEGFPKGFAYDEVLADLRALPHVKQVHDLRVWTLTTDQNAVSAHLAIELGDTEQDVEAETDRVLSLATKLMRTKYRVGLVTLQVEKLKKELMDDCKQCQAIT